MRHCKHKGKLGRSLSHRQALFVNMVKNLVLREKVITTDAKAKILCSHMDKLITVAKKNDVFAKRRVASILRIRKNAKRTPELKRPEHRSGDRDVMRVLFEVLLPRFQDRTSGFTRRVCGGVRKGDGAKLCRVCLIDSTFDNRTSAGVAQPIGN